MGSTFDGLYIAKSGVQAARINLNVTGQNITNANTPGYTRQRVDQSSVSPTCINMLYAGTGAIVGEGVSASGISQLRNSFLDGQYRTQNSQFGLTSTQISALQDIEDALNETKTDGIDSAYSALIKQLQGLTATGGSTSTESTIKEAASLLATKLNTAASQLNTIRGQQYSYLQKTGVGKVNTLLKSISSLSDQIKDADVSGSPALELMDERNSMIDELSQYVNVKVVETPTAIGAGKSVDTLSIYLADTNGDALPGSYPLVDGNQYSELTVTGNAKHADIKVSGLTKDGIHFSVESGAVSTDSDGKLLSGISSAYDFTLGAGAAHSVTITASAGDTMADLVTAAQAAVDGAIGAGKATVGLSSDGKRLTFSSADGSALSVSHPGAGVDPLGMSCTSSDRGVKNNDLKGGSLNGYLRLLNNNGEYDKAGPSDTTATERGIGYYENMLDTLAQKLASVMNADNSTNDAGDNKPIFTDSVGHTDDITAANIRIAAKWDDPQYSKGYLTLSKDPANAGSSTDGSNSNITKMITDLTTSQYTLSTSKGVGLFTGSLQEGVESVSLTLGQDIQATGSQNTANSTMLNNINTHRKAQSSVDTNEEAINLVVFNQALAASARFMTTVDECLNTLINNMGIVGRG